MGFELIYDSLKARPGGKSSAILITVELLMAIDDLPKGMVGYIYDEALPLHICNEDDLDIILITYRMRHPQKGMTGATFKAARGDDVSTLLLWGPGG